MRTASFRRTTVVLLLIAILAAPLAAVPYHESSGPAKTFELSPLDFLSHLWSFLWNAWTKEGCHIDPSGGCVP